MPEDAGTGDLLAAITFAAEKHRNQRRKDAAATPYINHPLQVAETLWRVGGVRDPAVLVAAVLHDTIEDTDTTPAEIVARFGPAVLTLVQEVSDDKSLPKATRKQLQVEHAPHKSPGAKLIKLADKLHNIHDVTVAPPPHWPRERVGAYLDWAAAVVAGLGATAAPALEAAFAAELAAARARLAAGRDGGDHSPAASSNSPAVLAATAAGENESGA